MEKSSPVTKELDSKSIPYRLYHHSSPPHSLEQAAQERGQRPEQVVRSILFRVDEGNYVMVLVGGPLRISWPKLREKMGVSRMTMAKPEEVLRETGYRTGAVAPFGLPHPIRVLVDESVIKADEISLGSGVRGTTVLMKSQDLLRALGIEAEVGNYVEE
jgi:Cys-tRNA(Pro) deacylase